ncbi:MAG: NAD(P)H-binding protein [Aquincola sp.]|nr:NAD(P)H-binding protein [Aquincola sp.]MDH4287647.1 NAD(P)H-binding protein [Aquincola sp.]MDH5329773.1 NAD(P)H-binding protein [Aquincola sp.]
MTRERPTVLLAGASGLVGRALLAQLLADDRARVHALLRREVPDLPASDALTPHLIDFARPAGLPRADELYVALGTTIKVAGSKAAFRAVDLDAVVSVARAAREAGVERCAVVSALGADPKARVFYNRVKGEMEGALRALRFERLVIARPSLLAGARAALGQPTRLGEQLTLGLLAPIGALLPASVRPIDAAVVARAMRLALRTDGLSTQILESGALQALGKDRA